MVGIVCIIFFHKRLQCLKVLIDYLQGTIVQGNILPPTPFVRVA